jgi:hypothetical protein
MLRSCDARYFRAVLEFLFPTTQFKALRKLDIWRKLWHVKKAQFQQRNLKKQIFNLYSSFHILVYTICSTYINVKIRIYRQIESSCECGNEPSGSIKCWETIE